MEKIKSKGRHEVKLPFKAGIWYTASSVITKGISLLTTPVFTRLMSAAEYAVYPLYISRMGILSALGGVEALGTALLVGMQKQSGKKDIMVRSAILLESTIIAIICILYFTFSGILGASGIIDGRLSLIMFMQVIFDGGIGMVLLKWRYEYKFIPVFLTNVLSSVLSAALAVFITERLSLGGEGRIIALLWVSAAAFAIALAGVRPKERLTDRESLRYLTARALPLIPQGLGTALLAGADRIMILRFYGAEELAKYSVAHSVGVAICFVSAALLMALRPWILRRLHAKEETAVRQAIDTCVPLLCIAVMAIICITPEAMRFLAPANYSEASIAAVATALSVLPSFLSTVTATGLVYHGKSSRALLPVLTGVGVNIFLNALLFRYLPYTIAALSSLAASCASLLLWIAVYRRASKRRLYSVGKFALTFSLTAISSYALFLLYDMPALRFILLAVILIAPIPLYKRAFEIVKE